MNPQGGSETVTTNTTGHTFAYYGAKTIGYPIAFTSFAVGFSNILDNSSYWSSTAENVTTVGIKLSAAGDTNNQQKTVKWLAMGV